MPFNLPNNGHAVDYVPAVARKDGTRIDDPLVALPGFPVFFLFFIAGTVFHE